jgi:hypothetical protein
VQEQEMLDTIKEFAWDDQQLRFDDEMARDVLTILYRLVNPETDMAMTVRVAIKIKLANDVEKGIRDWRGNLK